MAESTLTNDAALLGRAEESARRVRPGVPRAVALLPPHASPRRYARVRFDDHAEIVMLLPAADAGATEIGGPEAGDVENDPFVVTQRWLAGLEVPVPALWAVDPGLRAIWLEDLGDRDLDQWVNEQPGLHRSRYREAVALLADFTAAASRSAAPAEVQSRRFDAALLRWELDHYVEWRLGAALGVVPTPEQASRLSRLFDALVDQLVAIPEATIHRDFQSHNIMAVGEPARLVLLDFQDAMRGPVVYDAVALLRDSYVEIDADVLRALVDEWADALVARGVVSAADRSQLPRWFALQTVQRKLKDAGRFVFIDRVRNNPGFLRFIPSSLRYVADALALLPELDELRETLSELDADLASYLAKGASR